MNLGNGLRLGLGAVALMGTLVLCGCSSGITTEEEMTAARTDEIVACVADSVTSQVSAVSGRLAAMSADARFVGYASTSAEDASDTNEELDYYVLDRKLDVRRRVSVTSAGAQANGHPATQAPSDISMSDDGDLIVFTSGHHNLIPSGTNNGTNVYAHRSSTGQTEIVSVKTGGELGATRSWGADISGNGRYVTFLSQAQMVPQDTGYQVNAYLRDRQTGVTSWVSVGLGGAAPNGQSRFMRISGNGNYIVFASHASNLVANDTNGAADVFVRNRATGVTTRVSVTTAGLQLSEGADLPSISNDGRYVAFVSGSDELPGGGPTEPNHVYLHDRQTGKTTLLDVSNTAAAGDQPASFAEISGDGKRVVFGSSAQNLSDGVPTTATSLFARDLVRKQTRLVWADSGGADLALNGDGQALATVTGQQVYTHLDAAAWQAGKSYFVGDLVSYQSDYYEARVAHTAAAAWDPPSVPSLWQEPASCGLAAWEANTYYTLGSIVLYGAQQYQCLVAHTSLVGWEPPAVPSLWLPVDN